MNESHFARGKCQCGAVRLVVTGKPKNMVQCHCLDCQKSSGTGHASMAYFDSNDVAIEGKLVEYCVTADSGNKMTREFCPMCGSRILGRNDAQPDLVSISIGCLEDHSWYKPQVILFASRRNHWDITSTDIPNYDHMPAK